MDIKGRKSFDVLHKAIQVLLNLEHRGATGSESNSGDGAGMLLQVPHEFFQAYATQHEFELPDAGKYGVAAVFLPTDHESRLACQSIFEQIVREEGQQVIGWRDVPTDNSLIGRSARQSQPFIRQLFVGRRVELTDDDEFERKLYVIRRRVVRA